MEPCCYIGRGKVYIQKHGEGCPTTANPWSTPVIEVGNTENLQLDVVTNEIQLKNYTNAAGGNKCTYTEITSVDLTIDTSCFSKDNLRLALAGATQINEAGAISDESHVTASTDDFIALDQRYDPKETVTVADSAPTTYVEGTDYVLTPNGIKLLDGGGILDGTELLISYTALESNTVQTITSVSDSYTVIFDGINVAEDSSPVYMRLYNVKFDPNSINLIGDDFTKINLTANLLPWGCITPTSTLSDYGIIRI